MHARATRDSAQDRSSLNPAAGLAKLLCKYVPTVKHRVALVHDTPASALLAPGGFGLDSTVQCAPFHCSISVEPDGEPVAKVPAATQLRALEHERAESWLSV